MVTISAIAQHCLDVSLLAYIDARTLIVATGEGDRFGSQLWVGAAEESLEMLNGTLVPSTAPLHVNRRSTNNVERKVSSPLGDLLHLSSKRNQWDSYLWHAKTVPSSRKSLAVCRPQDFEVICQEGDRLTVRPKPRSIYCVGVSRSDRITLVTTVQDQPESAEVYTGANLRSLTRRLVRQTELYGSRAETRVDNNVLAFGRDGMHWSTVGASTERLRVLDSSSLTLELDHQSGTARLTGE